MAHETTIRNFDEKYASQGGVNKLLSMYNEGAGTSEIGRVFGLENKQVNYYLKRIVGEKYYRVPWRQALTDVGLSPLGRPKDIS